MRGRLIVALVLVTICLAWFAARVYKAKAADRELTKNTNAYRAAAERGDVRAEVKLASAYYYGKGVSRNYAEAARWYRKAAEQSDPEGQYGLGYLYYYGYGGNAGLR